MDKYTLLVRANAQDFESELRDAVESTSDQIANQLYHVEQRALDDAWLPIFMVIAYPDDMLPSPPGFDWGESPRQEVVHGALRCRVFPHGSESRVSLEITDERATEYGALLVQELEQRFGAATATQEPTMGKRLDPPPLEERDDWQDSPRLHPEVVERETKLRQAWQDGKSRSEAARDLGISESTIQRLSSDLNLKWRNKRTR